MAVRRTLKGREAAALPSVARSLENIQSHFLPSKVLRSIAVAVSGGADSMALAHYLIAWAVDRKIHVHLLTVDHGLRAESVAEALQVRDYVARYVGKNQWTHVSHEILTWRGRKPKARLQEAAREARYGLMANYCAQNRIPILFLAHHADDQAETVLFRLAKGSGLDGLGGMAACIDYSNQLKLLRPCLQVTHAQLIEYCQAHGIEWVEDPSNQQDRFARVRLRQSADVLAREGLTSLRLSQTAARLMRARHALDQLTEKIEKRAVVKKDSHSIDFKLTAILAMPEECLIRILSYHLQHIGLLEKKAKSPRVYPPRLEQVEILASHILLQGDGFKGATLAGCVLKVNKRQKLFTIRREGGC